MLFFVCISISLAQIEINLTSYINTFNLGSAVCSLWFQRSHLQPAIMGLDHNFSNLLVMLESCYQQLPQAPNISKLPFKISQSLAVLQFPASLLRVQRSSLPAGLSLGFPISLITRLFMEGVIDNTPALQKLYNFEIQIGWCFLILG